MLDGNLVAIVICIVSVGGFSWRISRTVNTALKEYSDEEAAKRNRIYARLDEVKKEAEKKFTQAIVCDERHKRVDEALVRIEGGVQYLVKKNGGG